MPEVKKAQGATRKGFFRLYGHVKEQKIMENVNPLFIVCGIALCWPGLIPMGIMFFLARRYDVSFSINQRIRTQLPEGEEI